MRFKIKIMIPLYSSIIYRLARGFVDCMMLMSAMTAAGQTVAQELKADPNRAAGSFYALPIGKMPKELRADLQDAMIFPLIRLTFKGENHDLIEATHGLEQFLVASEYQRYAGYLKPSLSYRFKGLKIMPVK